MTKKFVFSYTDHRKKEVEEVPILFVDGVIV
jgi:hypothetical protein